MIIEAYKFMHDNYKDHSTWKFIHYFLYDLTFISAIVIGFVSAVGIIATLVLFFSGDSLWSNVMKATIIGVIYTVISGSLLEWIGHE